MAIGDQLSQYVASGGFVMPPLLAATAVLWFCLGWRAMTIRRGTRHTLRERVRLAQEQKSVESHGIIDASVIQGVSLAGLGLRDLRDYLDDSFGQLEKEMKSFQAIVATIVMIAPLTGLLGTVAGMIETFDSLGSGSLFSQSGGVAGGISQALISTQMGLAVAIPGLLAGRILHKRQMRLQMELEQLKDLLCADTKPKR